jgi:hypothetical protein
MKRLFCLLCAVLVLSCSRAGPTVELVPSRQRVFAQSDSEATVTSWLPLGMSLPSAKASILSGLLIADAPVLDAEHKPVGKTLPRGSRVAIRDATAWEPAGREYHRWYAVSPEGSDTQEWVDSSSVVLITAQSGALRGGFLERKISVAGGESEYNVLALCDGEAVTLIDTSFLVFPDSFHPSGVTDVSFQDVNGDGVLEAVVHAQTIVSLQYLGASPLGWEAWMQEKAGRWRTIFRYNSSYGTDQGNSSTATRRAFSSTGGGFLDTVKVTADVVETTDQGVFATTTETFFLWNGTAYKENPAMALPQEGRVTAGRAEVKALPQADGAAVESLHAGDALYVFDRGDARQTVDGKAGVWLHVTTRAGKDGWIHSSLVKLAKIDPLKVNREVFLGQSGFKPPALPGGSANQ